MKIELYVKLALAVAAAAYVAVLLVSCSPPVDHLKNLSRYRLSRKQICEDRRAIKLYMPQCI